MRPNRMTRAEIDSTASSWLIAMTLGVSAAPLENPTKWMNSRKAVRATLVPSQYPAQSRPRTVKRMPPEVLHALLADYRQSLQATRADLGAVIEELTGSPRAQMGRLAALHGLRTAQARLAWIDEVQAELSTAPEQRRTPTERTLHGHRPSG